MRAPIQLDLHLPNFNYPGVGPEAVFEKLADIAVAAEQFEGNTRRKASPSLAQALRMVAQYADGCNRFGPPERAEHLLGSCMATARPWPRPG